MVKTKHRVPAGSIRRRFDSSSNWSPVMHENFVSCGSDAKSPRMVGLTTTNADLTMYKNRGKAPAENLRVQR